MSELLCFVKEFLGFSGDEQDNLLIPLIQGAKNYVVGAGFTEPEDTESDEYASYMQAVAIRVSIVHDGDPRCDKAALLADVVSQMRAGD